MSPLEIVILLPLLAALAVWLGAPARATSVGAAVLNLLLVFGLVWNFGTTAAGKAGYAYASAYRTRPAYRFSVENSVYVAPSAGQRGIGLALMEAVIEHCTAAGFRQMIAVIGDSGNAASMALHRRAGFTTAGLLKAAGWKHGRWVDSVLMQRPLGAGAERPPEND